MIDNKATWIGYWVALMAVTLIHTITYVELHYPLYASAHISSTASIAFIFMPLHAVWMMALCGILAGLLAHIVLRFRRPARGS